MAEMLILNNKIPMDIAGRYMKLAKEMNKEYKSIATKHKEAMGIVVASRKAVERDNVIPEFKDLPEKFKSTKHKNLCSECYEELENIDPELAKEFKKITFLDKMTGLNCGACK